MIWLELFLLFLIIIFGSVIWFGAIYLPTKKAVIDEALDMLKLKRSDVFIDFGSGDGRVLAKAAPKVELAIGYEINPILVIVSRCRLRKLSNCHIKWANYLKVDLPKGASAGFTFLRDGYLDDLIQRLQLIPDFRLVSYAYQSKNIKPDEATKNLSLYRVAKH